MSDAPSVETQLMSMQEFIRRSSHERFEYIDGEAIPLMPTTALHTKIAKLFFLALLPFEQRGLGEVFQEATFVLTDSPDWVKGARISDVMFVTKERMEQFRAEVPDWKHKPYI
ncbi:MAG: hypothetical protein CUN54_09840, partial [Phototrophicales bacterium]